MDAADAGDFLEHLNYRFSDPSLRDLALTHKSFSNENPQKSPRHNERLEFLGDAVLDFVISDLLMARYTEIAEGELSKIRANLVSESALATVARRLGLGQHIQLGRGESASGGQDKASILADGLEAMLAAIYLDSRAQHGMAEIERIIKLLFNDQIESAGLNATHTDDKTALQELVQKMFHENVIYRVAHEDGPDHEKSFEVAVTFQNREFGRGKGRSKKSAEQDAAHKAILALQKSSNEAR